MREACGIITSSVTAAEMLRTWNGMRSPSLPRAPSVSALFANANSFSGGSVQSAFGGTLPVEFERHRLLDERYLQAAEQFCQPKRRNGFVVRHNLLILT